MNMFPAQNDTKTLVHSQIAGWNIHHFDGICQETWGFWYIYIFFFFWWFVDGDGCIHSLKLTVCRWKMVLGRQAFRARVLPIFWEYLVIDLVEGIRISILRSVRCCYYSFCSRNIKKYIIYPCDSNLVTQTSWKVLVKHPQRDAERTFPLHNHGNGNWLVKDTIVLEMSWRANFSLYSCKIIFNIEILIMEGIAEWLKKKCIFIGL